MSNFMSVEFAFSGAGPPTIAGVNRRINSIKVPRIYPQNPK